MDDLTVTCLECGETFAMLRWMHLKRKHGLTSDQYLARHPGALLVPLGRRLSGPRNPAKQPGVGDKISVGRQGITAATSPAIAAEAARKSVAYRKPPRSPGLCGVSTCGFTAEPGRKMCRAHLDVLKARSARCREDRRASGSCPGCGRVPPDTEKKYCAACAQEKRASTSPEQQSASYRSRHIRRKDAAYAAYGGYACACCGESEPCFLSLDHVDGGGHRHRKSVPGSDIYKWLEQHGYPPGFQVLCMNCNHGRARNGGECPHETARRSRAQQEA